MVIYISCSRSPFRKTLSISTIFASHFSIVIQVNTTLKVTSFTTGKNIVSKVQVWDLTKPFCYQSGSIDPIALIFEYHLASNNLLAFGMLIDPTFLHTPMETILLNSNLVPSLHFSLASRSGCHQACWNVFGSDGSLISLVTNAISFNHSFRFDPNLISAKPAISVNLVDF